MIILKRGVGSGSAGAGGSSANASPDGAVTQRRLAVSSQGRVEERTPHSILWPSWLATAPSLVRRVLRPSARRV